MANQFKQTKSIKLTTQRATNQLEICQWQPTHPP